MRKKPFLKLRRLYEDEGLEQQEFSALCGIPKNTMKTRLNAEEGCWRYSEIIKICRTMHIPPEKIGEYFFPELGKEHNNA